MLNYRDWHELHELTRMVAAQHKTVATDCTDKNRINLVVARQGKYSGQQPIRFIRAIRGKKIPAFVSTYNPQSPLVYIRVIRGKIS